MPQCYMCEAEATSRDHFPPKAFFPRGERGNLRTIDACAAHNNQRSADDQYLLAHICMNAGRGDNAAKRVFMRSIVPALDRSPAFRAMLNQGAEWLASGARRYPVDVARFDNVFDGLCCAVYYDRYNQRFDLATHSMHHIYLSLDSDHPGFIQQRLFGEMMARDFFVDFRDMIERYEADHVDEIVYASEIAAPLGAEGSITIVHTFYGIFDVVSMLSRRPVAI